MQFNKILVTGNCGFIGSHFANMLHEQGENVFGIDSLTYAADITNMNPEIPFSDADINNITVRDTKDVDCIVHFAAETHVDNSLKNAMPFHQTNYLGTYNLLRIANEIKVKRFVYVSTDEVYGPSENGECFTEDAKLNPTNLYSASKAAAEMLVNAYHKTYGLDTIITRGSNAYGPNQFAEKLIPLCIKNALENKPLPIYGDGSARRMYIYVKDHARAIEHCLYHGESGNVYNIPGSIELSALDVAKQILNCLEKPTSLIEFVEDRRGHDCRYLMDGDKLRSLSFKYDHKMFYIWLKETIKYYKDKYHKERWGF
jgi:dTDP-glucose 4,6-dehydratase